MGSPIINYNLFRIEVFSTDGIQLKVIPFNDQHLFYSPGLLPQKDYNIVFTYDRRLLLCLSYTCKIPGKVVLINPAHIIYNCGLEKPNDNFIHVLHGIIKGGDEMEIVGLGFEKRILRKLRNLGRINVDDYFRRFGFYMFKAGKDLQQHFINEKKVR